MNNLDRVDSLLNRMTLNDKIGQMLVYGFSGTYPHPDILQVIEQYHVAGFRITPAERKQGPCLSLSDLPLDEAEMLLGRIRASGNVFASRRANVRVGT